MTMAIELSQMKSRSRLGCDGKENEKEDEEAGPSRSNCDNYGDERIVKRLRPEDYESLVSSSSSTNVRIHMEPAEVGPEGLKVEERRFHQYNESQDKNEDIIGNNAENIESKNGAENYEGNPLFLLVEAALGGFVSI